MAKYKPPSIQLNGQAKQLTPPQSPNSSVPTFSFPENGPSPFNFSPIPYSPSPQNFPPTARRKGHKYAESSVHITGHLATQTPTVPLQVPASLPTPTFREFRTSMSLAQRVRFGWCAVQLLIAWRLDLYASSSTQSVNALSHLLLLDAIGAAVHVVVHVARKYDAWARSSIRIPFGLQRAQVLAKLVESIALFFVGFDLISHSIRDGLDDMLAAPHMHSHHNGVHHPQLWSHLGLPAILGLISVTISATLFRQSQTQQHLTYSRNGQLWQPYLPSHYLTASLSAILLIFYCSAFSFTMQPESAMLSSMAVSLDEKNTALDPLPPKILPTHIDISLSVIYSLIMTLLGGRLFYRVAHTLLMANDDSVAVTRLIDQISSSTASTSTQPCVVDDARVWRVHDNLCMATFRVRVPSLEILEHVRERVQGLAQSILGGGASDTKTQHEQQRWEVSCQVVVAEKPDGEDCAGPTWSP